nr:hypothetical protein [uncultured Ottowia sp.]
MEYGRNGAWTHLNSLSFFNVFQPGGVNPPTLLYPPTAPAWPRLAWISSFVCVRQRVRLKRARAALSVASMRFFYEVKQLPLCQRDGASMRQSVKLLARAFSSLARKARGSVSSGLL